MHEFGVIRVGSVTTCTKLNENITEFNLAYDTEN